MNRRGFLSAICGAGALAAAPLALVAAPQSLAVPPVPTPPVLPPEPEPEPQSVLGEYAEHALDALLEACGDVRPLLLLDEVRLGQTERIPIYRPFVPYDVRPGGDYHECTLTRQSGYGIELPYGAARRLTRQAVLDAKEAGRLTGLDIRGDYVRGGARGLVTARPPDLRKSGYDVAGIAYASRDRVALRAVIAYRIEYDQFVVRFDALWGWLKQGPPIALYDYTCIVGGRHLQIVRSYYNA